MDEEGDAKKKLCGIAVKNLVIESEADEGGENPLKSDGVVDEGPLEVGSQVTRDTAIGIETRIDDANRMRNVLMVIAQRSTLKCTAMKNNILINFRAVRRFAGSLYVWLKSGLY